MKERVAMEASTYVAEEYLEGFMFVYMLSVVLIRLLVGSNRASDYLPAGQVVIGHQTIYLPGK